MKRAGHNRCRATQDNAPVMVVPIVVLFHEMVAGAERHQVGVVGRRGDGHAPRAADVRVAELVG